MKFVKCVNVDSEARKLSYQVGQQGRNFKGQEYRLAGVRIITSSTGQLSRINEWVHLGSVNKAKYLKDAHLEQFYPERYKFYKMRSNGPKDGKDLFYAENPRAKQFKNPANL